MTRPTTLRAAVFSVAAAVALGGCMAADAAPREAAPLSPQKAAQADRLLAGKVAGQPVNCLNPLNDRDMVRLSDDTIAYRVSRDLVYVNRLRYACPGLASDRDVIVLEKFGTSSSCSGDIFRLVDRVSGIPGGSCVLGEFTPYRPAR